MSLSVEPVMLTKAPRDITQEEPQPSTSTSHLCIRRSTTPDPLAARACPASGKFSANTLLKRDDSLWWEEGLSWLFLWNFNSVSLCYSFNLSGFYFCRWIVHICMYFWDQGSQKWPRVVCKIVAFVVFPIIIFHCVFWSCDKWECWTVCNRKDFFFLVCTLELFQCFRKYEET